MSERKKLNKARNFIAQNNIDEAKKLLWPLYSSHDLSIKLDTVLSLLVVLDHVTENNKLLEITNMGIDIATKLQRDDVRAFLIGKKILFLTSQLGFMIYRQKNLTLSQNVFKWIDFSLEKDKKEYGAIARKRAEIEKEIQQLESTVTMLIKSNTNHYFRGHIFMALGDYYSSKHLNDQLDLMEGGRVKSKIANIYYVRRWNVDKLLYSRKNRKKIYFSKKKCVYYFEQAITEFELGGNDSEQAHAVYNLAVRLKTIFNFARARKLLPKARALAERSDEKRLLSQIDLFEKELADKNRNIRNYVEEFGLDLL